MGGEWGLGASLALETLPIEARGLYSGIYQEGRTDIFEEWAYDSGRLCSSLLINFLFP